MSSIWGCSVDFFLSRPRVFTFLLSLPVHLYIYIYIYNIYLFICLWVCHIRRACYTAVTCHKTCKNFQVTQQPISFVLFSARDRIGCSCLFSHDTSLLRRRYKRPRLYGLGYPRQPSPRVTLGELIFHLLL